jgi:hypothetical protein
MAARNPRIQLPKVIRLKHGFGMRASVVYFSSTVKATVTLPTNGDSYSH